MMAAKEYAGEVDASPMTIELMKPIAPGLSVASGCAPSDCVAMMPPGRAPTGRWVVRADRRAVAHHRPQSGFLLPGCHPGRGSYCHSTDPFAPVGVAFSEISGERVRPCECCLSVRVEWAGRLR